MPPKKPPPTVTVKFSFRFKLFRLQIYMRPHVDATAGCEGFADTDEDIKLFIPSYNIAYLGSQITGYHPDVFAFFIL